MKRIKPVDLTDGRKDGIRKSLWSVIIYDDENKLDVCLTTEAIEIFRLREKVSVPVEFTVKSRKEDWPKDGYIQLEGSSRKWTNTSDKAFDKMKREIINALEERGDIIRDKDNKRAFNYDKYDNSTDLNTI